MSKNKNQHYVPAFYLYNFTNEIQRNESKGKPKRDTQIHHFDFEKKCLRERPIRKVAFESYLLSHKNDDGSYNHDLDLEIQQVEDNASTAIAELEDIYNFLVKKKPKTFEIAHQLIDSVMELLFWQIKRHPEIVRELVNECEKYLIEEDRPTHDAKKMALEVVRQIGKNGDLNIRNELNKKNKIILYTTSKDAHFITTDKPFVRLNKKGENGIAVPDTEMYYPLTSNLLLFMCNNGEKKQFVMENHRNFLREFNTYIAKSASNYIFGRSDKYIEKTTKKLANNSVNLPP